MTDEIDRRDQTGFPVRDAEARKAWERRLAEIQENARARSQSGKVKGRKKEVDWNEYESPPIGGAQRD